MAQLRLAITDLYGVQVARLDSYTDAQVTVPWNDSRTASVKLSAFDPAARHVRPLERMLKAWYAQEGQTDLVFWGPILAPSWVLHEDTVEVNAHDLSVRLKHHYLNARDSAVTTPGREPDDFKGSVPVSFVGMRRLRDAGLNSGSENDDAVPDLGIVNGTNTHPGAAKGFPQTTTVGSQAYPTATLNVVDQTLFPTSGTAYLGATLGPPPDYTITGATQTLTYTGKTDTGKLTGVTGWSGSGTVAAGTSVLGPGGKAKRMLCERGENVWDKMQELAQLPDGPDVELQPYDGSRDPAADSLNESADVPKSVAGGAFGLKAERALVVTDAGVLQKANVSVWLERAEVRDVALTVVAPDGRELTLVSHDTFALGNANFGTGSAGASRTKFDDDATTAIEDGTAPFAGYFRPKQALDGLRDVHVAGTWKLRVYADNDAGSGTLHNWAINFVPTASPPVTPPYARMNTYAKTDISGGGPKDKRASAQFHYGYGRDNVEQLTYTPAGDSVRNRVVAVTQNTGGDGGDVGTGPTHTQTRTNLASRQRFGNYVQWEAAGPLSQAADPADVLGDIAEYWLESLSYPPQAVEIVPRVLPASGSTGDLLSYMRDFRCGDLVRVSARWGQVVMTDPATGDDADWVDMIIREVVLSQKDEAGNVTTRVTAVPYVPAPAAPGQVADA